MMGMCTICGKPSIAMCPYCRKVICPGGYGLSGTCGLQHEEVCPEAKEVRLGQRKPVLEKAVEALREYVAKIEKFPLAEAHELGLMLVKRFGRVCERLQVAGSIRRRAPEVGDIELVVIPKLEASKDLFGPDGGSVNLLWKELDGICENGPDAKYLKAGDRYRQLLARTPKGRQIKVDIFTATAENWGWIFLVRTGSAAFSRHMATSLNKAGYTSDNGRIHSFQKPGKPIVTREEKDVFKLAKLGAVKPEKRSW